MSGLGCDRLRELAPELALGALSGTDRATAIGHLAGCGGCRGYVAELSAVVDELFLAVPERDPPAGFESRALRRMCRPRRPGRRWLVAAVATVALAATTGGFVGRMLTPRGAVRAGPMLDRSRQIVGEAFVYEGRTPFVFVSIDGWGESGPYVVEVVLDDGRHVRVTAIDLDRGRGAAGGTITAPLPSIRSVWVTDPDHESWCSFRL